MCIYTGSMEQWELSPAIVVKVLVHNFCNTAQFCYMYAAQQYVIIVHVVDTTYSGYYSVTIVHVQDIIVLPLYM